MSERPRPGRQRDTGTHEAILQATRELLLEVGYQNLTIEGVAGRAGAGKATIYRWWPSKGALVLEAAAEHLEIGRVPDTGSTQGDLLGAIQQLLTTFTDPIAGIVMFVVLAGLEDDPSLAIAFRDRWVSPWRESFGEAVQRGVERKEIPGDLGTEFLVDVVVGTVFQRALINRGADNLNLAEDLADFVLRIGGSK